MNTIKNTACNYALLQITDVEELKKASQELENEGKEEEEVREYQL